MEGSVMDTTAVANDRSGEMQQESGRTPQWPSDRYDELIRSALGPDALCHDTPIAGSLTGNDLLRAYTVGRVSRSMDQRERTLQTQGRAWFAAAGAGREAIGLAFARYLTD